MALIANEGVDAFLGNLRLGKAGGMFNECGAIDPLVKPAMGRFGDRAPLLVRSRIGAMDCGVLCLCMLVFALAVTARAVGGLLDLGPLGIICLTGCTSSSPKPMSSKCVTSARILSVPAEEDERLVEDLEDLEAVRPGGEPGASSATAFISLPKSCVLEVYVSSRGVDLIVLIVLNVFLGINSGFGMLTGGVTKGCFTRAQSGLKRMWVGRECVE